MERRAKEEAKVWSYTYQSPRKDSFLLAPFTLTFGEAGGGLFSCFGYDYRCYSGKACNKGQRPYLDQVSEGEVIEPERG